MYTFFESPSHGWLRVPRTEIETLGIEVTRYSYEDGTYLYLEEDCDLSTFINAKADRNDPVNFDIVTFRYVEEFPFGDITHIRS